LFSRAKDELLQMQYKVQNQESNAEAVRNSMQIELDKLRHWLQIYENRKAVLRPQYHETLKELELKLHEQEMFYRKQIKDLDSEMKRKSHGRPSDDSGYGRFCLFFFLIYKIRIRLLHVYTAIIRNDHCQY
jgi:hypothetical protein